MCKSGCRLDGVSPSVASPMIDCLLTALAGKVKQQLVRLFPLYLLNRLTFELQFVCVCVCVCVCYDHSSPRIESQGQRSMSGAHGHGNAVARSV